jgi:Fic family protein
MPYLLKKSVKGKTYYYLIANVRTAKGWKKIQVYAGAKPPTKQELSRYNLALKKRVDAYLKATDPLLRMIQPQDEKALEDVRKAYRKLLAQSPTVKEKYYEWFVTTYTYDSNAIEGSSLTLRETSAVLFEGIAPTGRPLRDIRAAENHKEAYDWMIRYKGDLSKQFILRLHKILTDGILEPNESGRIRKVQVYIRGAREIPPRPEDVEPRLAALLKWYKRNKKRYHPAVVASYFHGAYEGIHPFVDFNGRSGRLLLNFILMKNRFPPIDIRNKYRLKYYSAIAAAVAGDIKPLIRLVVGYLKEVPKID